MNYNLLMNIGITIVTVCVLVGIVFLIMEQMGIQIQQANELTYEKCCGGYVCSDTYYDLEEDKCKYVFEEQQKYYPFANLNWISIGIVFGIAMILVIVVRLIPIPEDKKKIKKHSGDKLLYAKGGSFYTKNAI